MLQVLLACTDQAAWETLARRRVCHFGYKFEYQVCISCNYMVALLLLHWVLPLQPFVDAVQKCGSAATNTTVSNSTAGNSTSATCNSRDATGPGQPCTSVLNCSALLCNKIFCHLQHVRLCLIDVRFSGPKHKCCSLNAGGSMYSQ